MRFKKIKLFFLTIINYILLIGGWSLGAFWMGGGAFFLPGFIFGFKDPQHPFMPECSVGIIIIFFLLMPVVGIGSMIITIKKLDYLENSSIDSNIYQNIDNNSILEKELILNRFELLDL